MNELRTKLITEANELNEKIDKLATFMDTDAFYEIDPLQSMLLGIQLNSMLSYYKTLETRVELIDAQ
ncbi:crAss001_48 related protein [Tenacibaculum piscium]|uniref:crAss001_48 related protein n=1 Tax=Tenacibaculum piscium TaxID=1458515 RepID=UPI00187B5C06|nr:hypothetical protein [Tenacibaculum piscium]MBE7691158.1 hypothetical protein [Tenacibaculum piscium]